MNYRLMQRLLGSTALYDPRDPQGDEGNDQDDGADGGFDEDDEGGEADEDDDLDEPDDQDDEPDDGDDADPPQQRQASRKDRRIATFETRAKEATERAERLERELAQARQGPAQPQQTTEQIRAERDRRLAAMTPEQRLEFQIQETRQETQAQINEIRFASWDTGDKASFDAQCAANPALKAVSKEVEQRLAELRKGGQNASRDTVAKFLIGEKALAKAGRSKTQGQRREQEGRQRQEARPMNGRGDVARDGQRRMSEQAARRKRLEGMNI